MYQQIPQNPAQNQQVNQSRRADKMDLMDRLLWQPLARKFITRPIVPYTPQGNEAQLEQRLRLTSNQVLLQVNESKFKKSFTYYVPTYIRLVIKNLTNIDHTRLEAEANVAIVITFVYGNQGLLKLPQEVAARLYNEVVLSFERDDSLRLTSANDNISVKEKEENSEITFTVRRKVHMRIEPDIHYTPFERLCLVLPITIQQLPAKRMALTPGNQTNEAIVKFNFMDRPNTKLITIDCKNQRNCGNYSLIQNSLMTRYSNELINSPNQPETPNFRDEDDGKPKNFQYALFAATMYKQPMASLFNIFLPLWGLALINLVIYYQSTDLAVRIASIATLMLAFINLDDNIRIQIPPHPKILFIEYLVYTEIMASLVCLGHSFVLRNVPVEQKREFEWMEMATLTFCCIFLVVEILLVIGRTLYHYKVDVPNFGLSREEEGWKTYKGRNKFNHLLWSNQKCDEDQKFSRVIAQNQAVSTRHRSIWMSKLEDVNDRLKRKSLQINFPQFERLHAYNLQLRRNQNN